MRSPDSRLTSQGEIYIWLSFQYRCYSKQETPPNWVNPTPLQVLCHISSIDAALGYPILMAGSVMIIIAYFFFFRPRKYMGYKSMRTLFRLKDTAFSYSHSVFAATATASDLQAANFVTLKITKQNNAFRGKKIGHKASI